MIGIALFIIAVLVISIWALIEVKRLKHKLWAIFLIAVILFLYLSAAIAFKGKDVNYKTVPGVFEATKIYFSWLTSAFGNLVTITSNAVHMDWGGNNSV